MLKKLWNNEDGMIVSAELALVLTVGVLAMIVGISEVAVAVNTELNDISNAIGSMNQSYVVSGFHATSGYKVKSAVAGSAFTDGLDDCDTNLSCDLVSGATGNTIEGY